MPITKSAKKALRSSIAKRRRNEKVRKQLDKTLKKVSEKTYSSVVSLVDKAAKRGIIHKNKAARIKSTLSKKIDPKKIEKRPNAGVKQQKTSAKPKKQSTAKPKIKTAKKKK